MRVVVDRFEGDFAVCEKDKGTMVDIDKRLLPMGVKEGDVLNVDITVDEQETMNRKEEIDKLTKDIWK